ncbi:MAG: cytochrome c family protein [Pseudomonadota bacterium]
MQRRDSRSTPVFLIAAFCLSLAALSACGGTADSPENGNAAPPLTAATLGEQIVLTPAEWLASEPYVSADPAAGKKTAGVCLACHSLTEGGPNMIGPNLHGFFASPVGNVAGYSYSNALSSAGFVWTPRALDAWLAEPAKFLPGNRMTYPGVPNADDRANLIAYLLAETGAE